MYLKRHANAWYYRLAPLLFGGTHILVIFAPIYASETVFFGLQMQNFLCPGEGGDPLPNPLPQITFRNMEIYVISTGARSLIIMMNVSNTARLKLDVIVLPPFLFGGNHILLIFAPNMHQKRFFSSSKCKISSALERGGGSIPPLRPRSLPRLVASFPRRLLSETWKYT